MMAITIKSEREVALMREAGRILADVLKALRGATRPGVTTADLDKLAHEEITRRGARPSFLGYRGFPASLCVSVNDEIVHGIPGPRVLKEGDIASIDVGAIYRGYQADTALTVPVGPIGPEAQKLLEVGEGSLYAGIDAARKGARLGDVSVAIQQFVESRGLSVVREYVGHGIGRDMHEDPQIPNYFDPKSPTPHQNLVLRPGMTLALEPMVNAGDWRTRVADDGWTVLTADGSLSAHFEHTIVIADDGATILTEP